MKPIKRFFRKLTELVYGDINEPSNELEKIISPDSDNVLNIFSSNMEDAADHITLYEPPSEINTECEETTDNNDSQSPDTIDGHNSCGKYGQDDDIIRHEPLPSPQIFQEPSLLFDLAEIVSEMDTVKSRLNSNESKDIIEFCQERIIECMKKQPLDTCGQESVFNAEIHSAVPFQIVADGTPIINCLRPGLIYQGKLLLKALVTV